MLADDPIGHREPEAGTLPNPFGGEEGIEHFRLDLGAHPVSGICHLKQDVGPRGEIGLPDGRSNVQIVCVRSNGQLELKSTYQSHFFIRSSSPSAHARATASPAFSCPGILCQPPFSMASARCQPLTASSALSFYSWFGCFINWATQMAA